jgi:glutathione S-transferase
MIIVYGSSISPFVRKVLAFAAEKGIEVEARPVGLANRDPDFLEASPFGKMPALRHVGAGPGGRDFTLADSTAIAVYLDAIGDGPKLIPDDPQARGRTIWFDEYADTILFACGGKMFFNRIVAPRFLGQPGDEAIAAKAECEELPPLLDYLERVAPAGGFLVGESLTLADISVASPFVNLRHLGFAVDAGRWPKASAYVASILSRPSFAGWIERETAFLARAA